MFHFWLPHISLINNNHTRIVVELQERKLTHLMLLLLLMMMMKMLMPCTGQALISGDALQPTAYTGVPQYPGLGGFGAFHLQLTSCLLSFSFYSFAFSVKF